MNSKAAFLFLLLTVMMLANDARVNPSAIECEVTSDCYKPCGKAYNCERAKCMNRICNCYANCP
uniref:Potassium channel toxin n=1 Tax=Hemiscorpius lepturus TaxID=520031 RepID=A0A1L4BJ31_HEMLE|nr:potassium channel toxin [Hemiscorpius lepturus]